MADVPKNRKKAYICTKFQRMPIPQQDTTYLSQQVDSLTVIKDSLTREQSFCVDSAMLYPGAFIPQNINAKRASDVFGSNTMLNPQINVLSEAREIEHFGLINRVVLHVLLILLFLLFVSVVYRFRSHIVMLMKIITSRTWLNNITEEKSVVFVLFINTCNIMGVISIITLLSALYVENFLDESFTGIRSVVDNTVVVIITVGVILVFIYRAIFHKIISKITGDHDLIEELIFFNKTVFALSALVMTPIALALGVRYAGNENVILPGCVIMLIIFMLYYAAKSFRFFMCKKISILQWFLYLCTVEILPISFYILMIVR